MAERSREVLADLLKAFAIVGVVYLHVFAALPSALGEVLCWLGRLGVPTFLILWAYFVEKRLLAGGDTMRYLRKRFWHTSRVFIVWSGLYALAAGPDWRVSPVRLAVRHFGGGAWPGQYFFLIILQLLVVYPIVRKVYDSPKLRSAAVAVVILLHLIVGYGFEQMPYVIQRAGVRPLVYHVIYVICGIALARGELPRIPQLTGLLLFCLPIERFLLSRLGWAHDPYVTPAALIGGLAVVAVTMQSAQTARFFDRWCSILRTVSSSTMTIFVANPIVLGIIFPLVGEPRGGPAYLVFASSLAVTALVVVACLLIARVIRLLRVEGWMN